MIITVISSGLSRLGARCLESVNGQVGVVVDHRVRPAGNGTARAEFQEERPLGRDRTE